MTMLPETLALVEDNLEFAEFLGRYLGERGITVRHFADSNDLITSATAFEQDFYLIDLTLPGVDGLELIKLLRRRTDAGIVALSGRSGTDVLRDVVHAGGDSLLAKPVQMEQVLLVVQAVHRRTGRSVTVGQWRLDRQGSVLVAPDGARVALSDADCVLMECFVQAKGEVVPRERLSQALGRGGSLNGPDDGLNAIVYRLRRRIERATPMLVPLQSRSRVGYLFKAPLSEA